jgi:hypothetical protein
VGVRQKERAAINELPSQFSCPRIHPRTLVELSIRVSILSAAFSAFPTQSHPLDCSALYLVDLSGLDCFKVW